MATIDSRKSKAQLIQELDLLRGRAKTQSADPVEEKAREIETRRVDAAVDGMTVETAVQSFTSTNLNVSRALADAQELAVQKVKELEVIDKAIEAKKEELRELHDKDVIASSTAALLADYDGKKKQLQADQAALEEEFTNKQAALERNFGSKKMELEFQIRNHQAQLNQKQQDEYRTAAENLNEQLRQKALAARNEEEGRMRNWQQREEALQKQENEITQLKAAAALFPAEMDAAVKKEVSIVSNSMKRDFDHRFAMAEQAAKSNEALAQQTIKTLEKRVADQTMEINGLRQEVAEGKNNITAIATKALDASSGALATNVLLQDRAGRDGQGAGKRS